MSKEIIILTISMGNDGAERVLSELSSQWVSQGNKGSIIQTHPESYCVKYSLSNEIEIINLHTTSNIKPIRYIQEIYQIVKVLNTRPKATVISFIVAPIFISAVASFFVKNRIVVSERNNPKECPSGKLQQKLRDWAFTRADVCVFQTEDAMKMFPKKAQKKGIIIPNPINGNLPKPFDGNRRKAIVAACRLHPQKNLKMLINSFAMLHEDYPEYTLEIYGQGSERETLECQIKALKLEQSVLLLGFEPDIHKKMIDATMYVSSSNYEGISNSMLEALGMGIPTIVTDCPVGGARMVINNGLNGVLVPVGDTNAFYLAMKKIIEDKEFARSISKEAVKISKVYPIEIISKEWIEVI